MSDSQKSKEAEAMGAAGPEVVTLDLAHLEAVAQHSESPVKTFAIEANMRNTEENPDKESTSVTPYLVRRVDSQELLPRPFKSTTALLVVNYLSLLCCCCTAVWGVKYAWKAKLKRNQGVYTSAIKEAKRSCFYLKLTLGLGIATYLIVTIVLLVEYVINPDPDA